ncbi:MAG: site-2 protease family protein [Erysipelotrichaceae bacterium]
MNFTFDNLKFLLPAVLIALTLHELAHGFVSYKLGDPTPKQEGRLSLNPFAHLDPFGTLCLIVFGFGWAKPVMVNPNYYKNPKVGMVLTAIAGPLTNFLIAFVCLLLDVLMIRFNLAYSNNFSFYIYNLLLVTSQISIGLGVFNLIPIPPLDGSKVLFALLPEQLYFKFMQYERYISVALIFVLYLGVLDAPLMMIRNGIANGLLNIVYPLVGF